MPESSHSKTRKLGCHEIMKDVHLFLSSLIVFCSLYTSTVAFATEELSGPLDDRPEWLACASTSECTSVELGCYYWQPINKNFASAIGVSSCLKSIPPGPQPTVSCVDHQCVNNPFTVRYWTRLEQYQKSQLVESRVEACSQVPGGVLNSADLSFWTQQYEAVLDEQIRSHQFPDNQLLTVTVQAVVPCAELVAWEQGQEKWRSIQSKNGSPRRVVVERVEPTYPLGNLYPLLLDYAEVYQQCGQTYSRKGSTFWGDMHADFELDTHGEIDPASLKATYPGVAYMRPFLECASNAFKMLSFLPPENHKPVHIEVLIQVESKSR